MKNSIYLLLLMALLTAFSCNAIPLNDRLAKTILIDRHHLAATKIRIDNNDLLLKDALEKLISDAELALIGVPFSVTDKERITPSGIKNDYASYSRYWWPDPDKPNGLPYIRRDGETNPNSQSSKESDRQRIGSFSANTETLGLAYYFTGKDKYAQKAAELLRVWFLDTDTRMNPNMNHAQCRPGHNNGSKSGVLDGRLLISALEGSLLIANSDALSDPEKNELKIWASKYLMWLTTNEIALDEATSNNNHGTFYDVQVMYFALYSENKIEATNIANNFIQNRLSSQIEFDGSMPEELARTRPLFYSIYNLHAMFLVAYLAEKVDVDIWQANNESSPLRTALDYLVPYADPNKSWPTPEIKKADRMKLLPILQMADRAYGRNSYMQNALKLSQEKRAIDRTNLAFPLMR